MKDVAKINWFKAKLIVYMAGYLAKKSIDEQTIKGAFHAISDSFKDKDEKSVLRAINILCAKIESYISERFKELEGVSEPLDREARQAEWQDEGKRRWYKGKH